MGLRRFARELVLQGIYAHELSNNTIDEVLENLLANNRTPASSSKFITELINIVIKNRSKFNKIVSQQAENWDLDRVALIDKIILWIALAEIFYFDDIPPNVSIDEAVELAKKFSTEKSGSFVNGILDGVIHSSIEIS